MAERNTIKRAPDPGASPAELRVRPGLIRFLWLFPVLLALGFGLLGAPFSRPVVNRSTAFLVEACAFIVRVCGGQAVARENLLLNPATGFSISVEDTCNASNVMILLGAAVLAFPASWRQKAKGLVAGAVALHAVNFVRIISLFYLGQYNFAWFEFAHWYVWEGLMMIVTLVLFWIWVQNSRENPQPISKKV